MSTFSNLVLASRPDMARLVFEACVHLGHSPCSISAFFQAIGADYNDFAHLNQIGRVAMENCAAGTLSEKQDAAVKAVMAAMPTYEKARA